MPKRKNPTLAKATCAALLAASFAVGSPLDAAAVSSLERYCNASWRQAGIPQADWEDCTHDTMLELLNRLPRQRDVARAITTSGSNQRRELVRSIWCVAQRWRRHFQRQPVSLTSLPDRARVDGDFANRLADEEIVQQALASLSATQREILELCRDGYAIAEIATRLDMPPARVSDQKYKAIKTLQRQFAASPLATANA